MTLIAGFTDATPGGDSTTPKTGDLSSAITAGSSSATIRITNTGDDLCNFYYRDTGTTTYFLSQLAPGTSTDVGIALTSARTFEYYFDAGALKVDVITFSGTAASSPASLADITSWLVMHEYTVAANGHLTSAEVQLCLDDIAAEIDMAATRYALIASQTLNEAYKKKITIKGTVAQALYVLRNVGATRGLTSDMVIISNETADRYKAEYDEAIVNMKSGLNLGA